MSRVLLTCILVTSLLLAGCGGSFFIGFVSNPQIPSNSVSGIVIVINLGSVNDFNFQPVTVTTVSFKNNGLSNTVNFCGDQKNQFHLNETVRADFAPGTLCSNLVAVVPL